jgi:hypothetical protein
MGFHLSLPYVLQVGAEMVWGDYKSKMSIYGDYGTSVNSDFNSEEDQQIMELAGNLAIWWIEPVPVDIEISWLTLHEMYNNYIIWVIFHLER